MRKGVGLQGKTTMKKYEIEISYPHQSSTDQAEQLGPMDALDVLSKFSAMNWKQLQVLQLQMVGGVTTFTVTDLDSQKSVQLSLNELSASDQLEFKLDSDIEILIPHKNLFGLLTLNSKDYISFRQLNFSRVRDYLQSFVEGNVDALKTEYQAHLAPPVHATGS